MTTVRFTHASATLAALIALSATTAAAQTARALPWDEAIQRLGIAGNATATDTLARTFGAPRMRVDALSDTAAAVPLVITRQVFVRRSAEGRVECPMPVMRVDSARAGEIPQAYVDSSRYASPAAPGAATRVHCVNPLAR